MQPSNEPASDPPSLNATASWYSSDAWSLYERICSHCGIETAKFLFERCIAKGREIDQERHARTSAADRRRQQPPLKLPTITAINAADRTQICRWWARLLTVDQNFGAREKRIIAHLTRRYVDVGGYPKGFNPKLPPIKQKGSPDARSASARLSKMFDLTNPHSEYSREKAKRQGKFSKAEFAATLVPEFGETGDHVLRKLRYRTKGR